MSNRPVQQKLKYTPVALELKKLCHANDDKLLNTSKTTLTPIIAFANYKNSKKKNIKMAKRIAIKI
jgi:hypothetical protein